MVLEIHVNPIPSERSLSSLFLFFSLSEKHKADFIIQQLMGVLDTDPHFSPLLFTVILGRFLE